MTDTDIRGIDILPHRPPFLFLDRLVKYGKEGSVGQVTFDPEWTLFKGHFPDDPMVPGGILVEAMAQSAAAGMLLCEREGIYEKTSDIILFAGVDEVEFGRPVRPGETFETHIDVIRIGHGFARVKATGFVAGERVIEAIIRCVAQR